MFWAVFYVYVVYPFHNGLILVHTVSTFKFNGSDYLCIETLFVELKTHLS